MHAARTTHPEIILRRFPCHLSPPRTRQLGDLGRQLLTSENAVLLTPVDPAELRADIDAVIDQSL